MDLSRTERSSNASGVSRRVSAADYLTRSGEHSPFTFMNASYRLDTRTTGASPSGRVDGAAHRRRGVLPPRGEASPVSPVARHAKTVSGPAWLAARGHAGG
jgi:hypothetical protein